MTRPGLASRLLLEYIRSMEDNEPKKSETMGTRGKIARAVAQIDADESLTDVQKIERKIEMLGRAKQEVARERSRDAEPKNVLDRASAILNAMCEPPEHPLEEEIDRVIAAYTAGLESLHSST
jgi:hypothetical protein